MIVGYVLQILERGAFLPPLSVSSPERPILNRVKKIVKHIANDPILNELRELIKLDENHNPKSKSKLNPY